jgi:two-component system sensor histidine kinase KdpD
VRHIADVFRCQAVVLLPDATRQLTRQIGLSAQFDRSTTDPGASQWVYEHGQMAGPGTGTLPGATALFLPLTASRGTLGVLGIRPAEPHALEAPEQPHLLEAFANQAALAFERAQLAEEAQQAHVKAETEQ